MTVVVVSTSQVVLVYDYMDVSVYWPKCAVCLCLRVFVCACVCVCVISNESNSKKPHVSDLSKLMSCCIKHTARSLWYKLPRLDMDRSIISLSKIIHQMWHNHPFTSNVTQYTHSEQWGWKLEARGKGGWTKFEKMAWEI